MGLQPLDPYGMTTKDNEMRRSGVRNPNNAAFRMGGQMPITFDRFIRGLIGLIILAGIGVGLYWLRDVLLPFFIAWVVAYLLYPVVCFFQYTCHLKNRLAAIIVTLALTLGILGGFFYIVVPPMVEEMGHLKTVALEFIKQGASSDVIPPAVQKFLHEHVNEYRIEQLLQQENIVEGLKTAVPKVWNVVWSTAGILFNFVASLIGLLYLLFLLTDYEKYAHGWTDFVPKKNHNFAKALITDIEHGMAGYFRGQALVALSNCFMFSIGFLIIGFPMPIALGCLIGFISFVPYLQVVGFLPATLLAILKAVETGESFSWLMCLVLIVYIVVQILQDTIFTPRIMGKIMGLPPAIILLSLSVWGYALGIIGLIIALPVTTLMISYYKRYVMAVDGKGNDADSPSEELDTAIETPEEDASGQTAEAVTAPTESPAKPD